MSIKINMFSMKGNKINTLKIVGIINARDRNDIPFTLYSAFMQRRKIWNENHFFSLQNSMSFLPQANPFYRIISPPTMPTPFLNLVPLNSTWNDHYPITNREKAPTSKYSVCLSLSLSLFGFGLGKKEGEDMEGIN